MNKAVESRYYEYLVHETSKLYRQRHFTAGKNIRPFYEEACRKLFEEWGVGIDLAANRDGYRAFCADVRAAVAASADNGRR